MLFFSSAASELYSFYHSPKPYTVLEDGLQALEALQERNICVGAISNFDNRLHDIIPGKYKTYKYSNANQWFDSCNIIGNSVTHLVKNLRSGHKEVSQFCNYLRRCKKLKTRIKNIWNGRKTKQYCKPQTQSNTSHW